MVTSCAVSGRSVLHRQLAVKNTRPGRTEWPRTDSCRAVRGRWKCLSSNAAIRCIPDAPPSPSMLQLQTSSNLDCDHQRAGCGSFVPPPRTRGGVALQRSSLKQKDAWCRQTLWNQSRQARNNGRRWGHLTPSWRARISARGADDACRYSCHCLLSCLRGCSAIGVEERRR